ncbi:MAG: hypothetical protein JKY50_00185 [Oleispira sp.]|nr:hypothetical protein [Oleispira sp.]
MMWFMKDCISKEDREMLDSLRAAKKIEEQKQDRYFLKKNLLDFLFETYTTNKHKVSLIGQTNRPYVTKEEQQTLRKAKAIVARVQGDDLGFDLYNVFTRKRWGM